MSQTELAEAVGVTVNTISALERGRPPRDPALIVRLADALGVSVGWLLRPVSDDRVILAETQPVRTELPPNVAKAARQLVDAFKREMALGGATGDELHYIETVLMTPNLPPTLAGGHVPPDRLLEHIQGLMDPIRMLLRDAGRQV